MAIRLERVVKRFDDRPVLKDINLAVREGEFVAIVGRSGCGKSTLLRLAAGLDPVSEGSLLRGGKPAEGVDPATRVMFQDARLLPWKSVLDNVRIGIRGVSGKDAELKAREALQLVGLQDRAGDWPSVLSGGQRQRVALARALAGEPRLLLFDEPLGALDALTRIEMQRLIERLWEKRRFTALLVTHDVSEAVALADRVVLIEEGRIALDLPVSLARPRERDSGFAYFEKRILDRVLRTEESGSGLQKLAYDI
ncbi:ATP-binding cassette domain-containing protein [Paenibacillus thailandensis]|uniref:ATP-binding cassette domain-containing protein n=1 Tax=Paenibacillus thailandensis TaxID=393250 RepID=A0ABW5QRK0_9BACL